HFERRRGRRGRADGVGEHGAQLMPAQRGRGSRDFVFGFGGAPDLDPRRAFADPVFPLHLRFGGADRSRGDGGAFAFCERQRGRRVRGDGGREQHGQRGAGRGRATRFVLEHGAVQEAALRAGDGGDRECAARQRPGHFRAGGVFAVRVPRRPVVDGNLPLDRRGRDAGARRREGGRVAFHRGGRQRLFFDRRRAG